MAHHIWNVALLMVAVAVLQNRTESQDVIVNGDCHDHRISCIYPPTLDTNGYMTSRFSYSCHNTCGSHKYERGLCVQSQEFCKEAGKYWVCLCIGKITGDIKEGTSHFSY